VLLTSEQRALPMVSIELLIDAGSRFEPADQAGLANLTAKLLLGRSGSNGKLKVAADHIVFDGRESGESRTWKFSDINNVTSSDPFELTISTVEGENRVQLKTALTEDRYQDLWLRISQYHGLRVFGAAAVHEH